MHTRAFISQAPSACRRLSCRASATSTTAAPAKLALNVTKRNLVDSQGGRTQRNIDGEVWDLVYTPTLDSVRAINRTTSMEYQTEIGEKDNRVSVLLETAVPLPGPPTFGQLQSVLKGDSPNVEILNGRVAMASFFGVAAVELATGQSLVQQAANPANVAAALGLTLAVMAASLAPALLGRVRVAQVFPSVNDRYTDRQLPSSFEPLAEVLNGRLAMVGLAGLLVTELVRGSALF